MALTKTRVLMGELVAAMNLPGLPPDDNGGYQVTIGDDAQVMIFGSDDENLLVVAPIGPLPADIGYAETVYLLRLNMIDGEIAPFQVGLDESGNLLLWARIAIEQVSGESLASGLDAIADKVREIRNDLAGEEEEATT